MDNNSAQMPLNTAITADAITSMPVSVLISVEPTLSNHHPRPSPVLRESGGVCATENSSRHIGHCSHPWSLKRGRLIYVTRASARHCNTHVRWWRRWPVERHIGAGQVSVRAPLVSLENGERESGLRLRKDDLVSRKPVIVSAVNVTWNRGLQLILRRGPE